MLQDTVMSMDVFLR